VAGVATKPVAYWSPKSATIVVPRLEMYSRVPDLYSMVVTSRLGARHVENVREGRVVDPDLVGRRVIAELLGQRVVVGVEQRVVGVEGNVRLAAPWWCAFA
jgi:hypothetical protein